MFVNRQALRLIVGDEMDVRKAGVAHPLQHMADRVGDHPAPIAGELDRRMREASWGSFLCCRVGGRYPVRTPDRPAGRIVRSAIGRHGRDSNCCFRQKRQTGQRVLRESASEFSPSKVVEGCEVRLGIQGSSSIHVAIRYRPMPAMPMLELPVEIARPSPTFRARRNRNPTVKANLEGYLTTKFSRVCNPMPAPPSERRNRGGPDLRNSRCSQAESR